MRIERERIGAGQAAQQRAELLAHMEERAVRSVDVVPDAFGSAQVSNRVERVDGTGIGRAG